MKHLKKFNESIGLSHIHPSIDYLRSKGDLNLPIVIRDYIEWYNDKIGFDKEWKDYFNSELDKYPEEDSIHDAIQKHTDPIVDRLKLSAFKSQNLHDTKLT